ncbi:MAG: response regulator [Rhodospirillaceae bacterium]|nr:response regulator [Rhodospirillaceae bacterium]
MSRHSIVLVESEPTTRTFLTRLLERRGHGVTATGDVGSAMAVMDDTPPDIVLLDGQGPEREACAVLETLRSRYNGGSPKVVMVGTRSRPREGEKYCALGADAYLSKPFLMAELDATLSRLLPG